MRLATEADDAFAPQEIVGHGGDVAHVNAAEHDRTAFAHGFERVRHERSNGREDDGRIEGRGRALVGAAGPDAAQLAREALRRRIAFSGEGVDGDALVPGDLGHDVGGGAAVRCPTCGRALPCAGTGSR